MGKNLAHHDRIARRRYNRCQRAVEMLLCGGAKASDRRGGYLRVRKSTLVESSVRIKRNPLEKVDLVKILAMHLMSAGIE